MCIINSFNYFIQIGKTKNGLEVNFLQVKKGQFKPMQSYPVISILIGVVCSRMTLVTASLNGLKKHNVNQMAFTDLNLTEHLWLISERHLRQHCLPPSSKHQMRGCLL